ncbi:O-acetyl-ADP-ribose deacetylase [Thermospira aquatica]|uniref:O-acetyl-ADP-ribose deacetylase n=1 Tax=Thermospira aquatica TaxID=2828656 RepID=A0AAX3BCK2_9SPIR|nr:O-acetyl-ADP-ribose deacetylase [Thermospira aquatica]URA09972.1 O-acetyl-ADP-ribose deacetylase [Thermospira aquatica]
MTSFLSDRVLVLQGDITRVQADAIVNAANSTLMGGGGVDGAIHRAGGPAILEACEEIRRTIWPEGLPPGKAVATTAGRLPARYVIHTVGPIWRGGKQGEDELLVSAYRESLKLAYELGCKSIAFPAISTGVYGFPFERSVPLVCSVVREWAASFEKIILVFFSQRDYDLFLSLQTFEEA